MADEGCPEGIVLVLVLGSSEEIWRELLSANLANLREWGDEGSPEGASASGLAVPPRGFAPSPHRRCNPLARMHLRVVIHE